MVKARVCGALTEGDGVPLIPGHVAARLAELVAAATEGGGCLVLGEQPRGERR